MASAESSHPVFPTRQGGEGGPEGSEIRSAYGLHFADEALSAVRHDVLNRMTALGALSFELRRGLGVPRGEVRERLEDLNRQIGSICESVSRRLAPSRTDPPPRCSVREVFERVAGLCPGPVDLPEGSPARLWAVIDPVQLGVALLCVVENAVQACAERPGSRVRLMCEALYDDRIAIQVVDGGPGLDAQAQARAFDRFFSTRPGQAGLGLCVARTILVRWLGDLQLTNRSDDESGARATLLIPAAPRRGRSEGG